MTEMKYVRLVYRSRATAKDPEGKQLEQILKVARRQNREHAITGALTLFDDNFVQVIEGPIVAVENLMAALARDPRHRDIQILGRWAVSARLFGGWAMVCAPIMTPISEKEYSVFRTGGGVELVGLLLRLSQDLPFV